MKSLVGCVKNIVYHSHTGPWARGALTAYVVANFPIFLIRDYQMFFPYKPYTWAPITMDKFQCEKYCCLEINIPPRV